MNAPVTQSEQTALAVAPRQQFDLSPQTFDQALTFADYLAASEMVPKAYRGKPGDCLIAMQWGYEVGLKPLQALQSIATINGKPGVFGDAGKAILLAKGCVIEEDDIAIVEKNARARCKITRPGRPPVERTFSLDNAKTAGLWNKEGPWRSYPWRQMAWRAFWFAARDAASDLLRGLPGLEELADIAPPTERDMGAADVVGAPPPPPAPKPDKPEFDDAQFTKRKARLVEFFQAGKTAEEVITFYSAQSFIPEAMAKRIRELHAEVTNAVTDVAPKVTYAEVADALHKATTIEALDAAADLINAIADEGQRAELSGIYDLRREAIDNA